MLSCNALIQCCTLYEHQVTIPPFHVTLDTKHSILIPLPVAPNIFNIFLLVLLSTLFHPTGTSHYSLTLLFVASQF